MKGPFACLCVVLLLCVCHSFVFALPLSPTTSHLTYDYEFLYPPSHDYGQPFIGPVADSVLYVVDNTVYNTSVSGGVYLPGATPLANCSVQGLNFVALPNQPHPSIVGTGFAYDQYAIIIYDLSTCTQRAVPISLTFSNFLTAPVYDSKRNVVYTMTQQNNNFPQQTYAYVLATSLTTGRTDILKAFPNATFDSYSAKGSLFYDAQNDIVTGFEFVGFTDNGSLFYINRTTNTFQTIVAFGGKYGTPAGITFDHSRSLFIVTQADSNQISSLFHLSYFNQWTLLASTAQYQNAGIQLAYDESTQLVVLFGEYFISTYVMGDAAIQLAHSFTGSPSDCDMAVSTPLIVPVSDNVRAVPGFCDGGGAGDGGAFSLTITFNS